MSQRSMIWPRTMTWTSTSLVRMPCASLTKTAICCHLKIRTETGSGSSQASWSVFLRNWAIHSGLLYIYYILYIYLPLVWDSWYVPIIWDDDFNRLMFSHGEKPPSNAGVVEREAPWKIWLFSNCTLLCISGGSTVACLQISWTRRWSTRFLGAKQNRNLGIPSDL